MTPIVYTLADPRSREVRYVGMSADPRFRFYKHLSMARTWGAYPCARWIRELLCEGLKPDLQLLEVAEGQRPWLAEQRWIQLFRAIGCDLTNRHIPKPPPNHPDPIGTSLRVRELREAADITKTELARLAGVTEKTIRNLEHGKHLPQWGTAERIAAALGVSVADLLDKEPLST